AWAIRLLIDEMPIDTIYSKRVGPDVKMPAELEVRLVAMARDDSSGLVRLVLASTLQRMPVSHRGPLARALMSRVEDASDHNIPSLVWTALIPVADADPASLIALAKGCRLPGVLRPIARRLAEDIESRPEALNGLLAAAVTESPASRS